MNNFFSKYKFIFYFCNFILIFLYLFPGSILGWLFYNNLSQQPQITSDFYFSNLKISTNHVYAFLIFKKADLINNFNLSLSNLLYSKYMNLNYKYLSNIETSKILRNVKSLFLDKDFVKCVFVRWCRMRRDKHLQSKLFSIAYLNRTNLIDKLWTTIPFYILW